MANTQREREFDGPIVVSVSKLNRMVDIAHSRLEKLQIPSEEQEFRLSTRNFTGRASTYSHLDGPLSEDNSIKNPIKSLVMRWDVLGARINISFGDNEYPRFFGRNYSRAEVIVSGADSTWVGETFAEIEEQVERTQVKGIYRTLGKALGSGFLSTVAGLVGLIVILSVLGTLMAASIGDKAPKLGYQVRQELLQKAKSASTVDDKVNFLVSWQTIALEESIKNDENTVGMVRYIFSKKSAYIVFPILLVLVCICYVGAKCCPGLVFEWGDWEDHYRQIVKRRGQIMMGVIVAFIVGVLGSLFASAF